jgi:hypothetical protein
MPRFSPTACAPAAAVVRPAATSTSHPSAAEATASACPAITPAARSAADGGIFPVNTWRTISRTDWPAGTSGTPTRASRSEKSGGAHTRTSTPSARSAPANPTIGSTSPRDPYVDNNTRTCRPPFPKILGPACDYAA